MKAWIKLACQRSIVLRACKTSALVGTILMAINQGDVLLGGDVTAGTLLKIGLTFMVPYLVSTHASVAAIREMN